MRAKLYRFPTADAGPVMQSIGPRPDEPGHPERWWTRDGAGVLWVWSYVWDGKIPKFDKNGHQWTERTYVPRPAPVPEWEILEWEDRLPICDPDPGHISLALDSCGLYGPEVDEALGVADALDTVVDSWEDGSATPTRPELLRLATLTGYAPQWFLAGPLPELSHVFICEGDE